MLRLALAGALFCSISVAAEDRDLLASCKLQGRASAHFGSQVVPAKAAKVYILYGSEYVPNEFRHGLGGDFTHHLTLYTAGGVFNHRYIELVEHDKILKAKDKKPPTDERALEISERSIKYADQALAETVDWAAKHQKDAWTLSVVTPDEQGSWEAQNLKPGSYDVIVRGGVSQLDAAWFFSYDVEPEKTIFLEGQPRFFHPMKMPAPAQQDIKPNMGTPTSQPGTATTTNDVTGPKPGVFYDKELDLHFNYPVEMQALDFSAEMESGHRNIYGVSGEDDPVHQQAKRCLRPLVDVDLPQAKAPQRAADIGGIWVDDTKAYKESRKPVPIYAKIVLGEVVRDCLPEKLQKNENDALGNIALTFVSWPGIQPMPKPIWYEVGKQKIHMNSGVGRPIVNGQLASAPIIVMAMSTKWRGHLLAWLFTSNDTEIFNEMTKSLVQFGSNDWGPMFAANIGPRGQGTPMTILPK